MFVMNQWLAERKSILLVGIGALLASVIYLLMLSSTQIEASSVESKGGFTFLASTLGISTYAAKQAIDIIDAASTLVSIISLLAVVTGAGAISYAIVATAKSMIKKYGKKYAAAW